MAEPAGVEHPKSAPSPPDLEDELEARLARLSLRQKVRLLTGADLWSLHEEPTVGLRRLVVSDGPAGVRGELWDERDTSANVPSPTALAATWDEARVERLGAMLAGEARRKGVDVLLAPTVNLHRSPYGGRHFECFSEDPVLTGRIGAAFVRGVQGGGVGATVKHVVANDAETDRYDVDVRLDERTLRELYLAPFEVIVRDAGVWSVMAAYNAVGGVTMTEHPLLREVLQEEWRFDGVTMTDWFAGRSTDASANAGLDLVMPGPSGRWGDALVDAVTAGRVPTEVVDDKVLRVLRLAARVGALDGIDPAVPEVTPWPQPEVAAELRAVAADGFVLLRNAHVDGAPVLPLATEQLTRVAVLGPNAAVARTLGGGSATVHAPYTVSPLAGLRSALADREVRVEHRVGVLSSDRLPPAPVELLTVPDRSGPGVLVRFLGVDGTELGRETRTATSWTWQPTVLPGVPVSDVVEVEVTTWFEVDADGDHRIGASGVGPFVLTVDGETVIDEVLSLPAGADPVEGIMRPPQVSSTVSLEAGRPVPVRLRHRVGHGPAFGDTAVTSLTFQLNASPRFDEDHELEDAVALAADSDVAVVVVGTTEEVESEGFDRDDLALPGRQDELVRRVVAANPRTVVLVNAGAPVLLPWADDVPAVLVIWFPGQEAGNAIADVLLGQVEPGGRLPTTWPVDASAPLPSVTPAGGRLEYDESLHVGHRAFLRAGVEPRYWFGHGLGYTTWDHSAVDVATDGDDVEVTVHLANVGDRVGKEVVQVYAAREDSAVERPARWLVGAAVAHAAPGDEVAVRVRIPWRAFAHWDVDGHTWVVEPGEFRLLVGRSCVDTPLEARVRPSTHRVDRSATR